MLQRMSIAEFLGTIITQVRERTGLPCVSDPDGEKSPFYSVELLQTQPQNNKTEYIDRYDVNIHCISEPVRPYSSAPVLDLVQRLEEAMSEDVGLPEPFDLCRQEYGGIQAIKRDESDEGHAVLSFSFLVGYGFRCK